jgi:hypothetical protein
MTTYFTFPPLLKDQLARDTEEFINNCSSRPDLDAAPFPLLSFLESIQSYREDMQEFNNLNSAISFLHQRFGLPFPSKEQQYTEDRNDIQQDLQRTRDILETLTNNAHLSDQWNQEARLLLRYAKQDMNHLVSKEHPILPSNSLTCIFTDSRMDKI